MIGVVLNDCGNETNRRDLQRTSEKLQQLEISIGWINHSRISAVSFAAPAILN
jgi:hypothetical protein